jgi:hypothetical protein
MWVSMRWRAQFEEGSASTVPAAVAFTSATWDRRLNAEDDATDLSWLVTLLSEVCQTSELSDLSFPTEVILTAALTIA